MYMALHVYFLLGVYIVTVKLTIFMFLYNIANRKAQLIWTHDILRILFGLGIRKCMSVHVCLSVHFLAKQNANGVLLRAGKTERFPQIW